MIRLALFPSPAAGAVVGGSGRALLLADTLPSHCLPGDDFSSNIQPSIQSLPARIPDSMARVK